MGVEFQVGQLVQGVEGGIVAGAIVTGFQLTLFERQGFSVRLAPKGIPGCFTRPISALKQKRFRLLAVGGLEKSGEEEVQDYKVFTEQKLVLEWTLKQQKMNMETLLNMEVLDQLKTEREWT